MDPAELRTLAAAEEVDPGPWHAADRGVGWEVHKPGCPADARCWESLPDGSWPPARSVIDDPYGKGTMPEAMARYIAALSPERITALLDCVEAAQDVDGLWTADDDEPIRWQAEAGEAIGDLRAALDRLAAL